jgi:hypothetical protein
MTVYPTLYRVGLYRILPETATIAASPSRQDFKNAG